MRPNSKVLEMLSENRNGARRHLIPYNMELSDDLAEKLLMRTKSTSPSLPASPDRTNANLRGYDSNANNRFDQAQRTSLERINNQSG